MVRGRGWSCGDRIVDAASRSHQGLPGGPRSPRRLRGESGSLAKCVVCRLTLHAFGAMCVAALRCCGVASVNCEFVQGTKSADSASVTSMRNRLTPEHISDASSGRCSRSPSMFGCSRMEDVSLDEARSCKQDILTISSYSHKTEDRTQLVIVRQTVLCLVTSRFASTTRTPEGVNGIETLNLQVCVCVDPAPL